MRGPQTYGRKRGAARSRKLSQRNVPKIVRDACEGDKSCNDLCHSASGIVSKSTIRNAFMHTGVFRCQPMKHALSVTKRAIKDCLQWEMD